MIDRRRFRTGLKRTLSVCLPDPLEIPTPPNLAELLGYPCVPPERYVAFYWTCDRDDQTQNLMWFDGLLCGYADPMVWDGYVNHLLISTTLSNYALGGPGVDGARASGDCLLVNTTENRLHGVPIPRGCALASRFAGDVLRSLPQPQGLGYLRAAQTLVHPPADVKVVHVEQLQNERLGHLHRWLNVHGLSF